ncbi:invasion plasmid antigen / internalinputative [Salmonella enterica]|nr:invasion plasmid antigen / internalinputative [Salmonella enterica]
MFNINNLRSTIRTGLPLPSSTETPSPEESVWRKVSTFFSAENQTEAWNCLMELCHPPQAIIPENISSTFDRLRELAFPALMDNIQIHTEGLNQFCILDTNSREALVLTIEPNHYTITWDGVTMMYSYDIAGSAISDTVLLSSLDEYEAICSEWLNNAPHEEAENRNTAVTRIRDCLTNQSAELNLNNLHLTTLPARLPEHITVLTVTHNRLSVLPETLPAGLQQLDVSYNQLTTMPITLPEGIDNLNISNNQLRQLPLTLPVGLRQLEAANNRLAQLPDSFPPALEWLDVSHNRLPRLPQSIFNNFGAIMAENNPFTEQAMHNLQTLISALDYRGPQVYFSQVDTDLMSQNIPAYEAAWSSWIESASTAEAGNRRIAVDRMREYLHNGGNHLDLGNLYLTSLPDALPENVTFLIISGNQLTELPQPLPENLRQLFVQRNSLNALPDKLPESLRILMASDNHLSSLPESVPPGLLRLDVSSNRLIHLPESVLHLSRISDVNVSRNPLSERVILNLQIITTATNYQGPQINFTMTGTSAYQDIRPLYRAVSDWLILTKESKIEQWTVFAGEANAPAFSRFLDRLGNTVNMQNNPHFKTKVTALLERLTHDAKLRELIFTAVMDASESCEDRITLTYNNIERIMMVHDAEQGTFDNSLAELVSAGREMFRLTQLEQIAQEKAKTLNLVDEIEVYLGYQNRLRERLKLMTSAPKMRFFGVSGIKDSDLEEAELRVKTAEDRQFREWFTLWEPWHKVIERIAPEIWTEILTEKNRIVETGEFIARVNDELRLPNRSDDIVTEVTAGVKVMREIDLRLFNSATERVLAKTDQEHLLKPQWA